MKKTDWLYCVGVSYKESNVDVRNKFSISDDAYLKILRAAQYIGIEDIFALSTCNRSEIYFVHDKFEDFVDAIDPILSLNDPELNKFSYKKQGKDAVEHLFNVASGLDSQITGDNDIVNQIKKSRRFVEENCSQGSYMQRLLNVAIGTSKRVKKNTTISDGQTSVSFAVVKHIVEKIVPSLSDHTLIIGLGEMGASVARSFSIHLPNHPLILMNRNIRKAEKLGKEIKNTVVVPITYASEIIRHAKIIVVATAAGELNILNKALLNDKQEYHVLDISIPSNVENAVKKSKFINYVDVDMVSKSISKSIEKRRNDVPKAKEIVSNNLQDFLFWDDKRQFVPYLKLTRRQLEDFNTKQKCPYKSELEKQKKINEIVKTMAKQSKVKDIHACDYMNAVIKLMDDFNTKKSTLKIGTRDSKLAMYQAKRVKSALLDKGLNAHIEPVKSQGDKDLISPLYEMGIEGIFTRSLDQALLSNKVDIAVHSLKDVPTALAKGLSLDTILDRGDYHDIAIYKATAKKKNPVKAKLVVATSSVRRKAMWLNVYPHHEIKNIRGNIQTRLKKFYEGDFDVLIMAKTAVDRLELDLANVEVLDFLPAPAQGAIGIISKDPDNSLRDALSQINNQQDFLCTSIERKFLNVLGGGCTSPVGALAKIENDLIVFEGVVLSLNGENKIEIAKEIHQSEFKPKMVEEWAKEILSAGADKILKNIRKNDK